MHLRMLDEENFDMAQYTAELRQVHWLDPLALHDRWKPRLLSLCEKLCQEIETCS
jgi:hypothetical protein